MKILIVEDEPELLQNIAAYLMTSEEIEVRMALSGEKALAFLESENSIDVLLTDVRLPGIDGIEVVRRTVQGWPNVKIVVMTAFGSPDTKTRALRDGALRFIEKPLDMENLKSILKEVNQPRRGWSGAVCDLDIFDLTQLFLMTRRNRTVRVESHNNSGILAFEAGTLTHASTRGQQGAPAFCEMIGWDGGAFEQISNGDVDHKPNINIPTTRLMLEAARLRDENADRTLLEDRS